MITYKAIAWRKLVPITNPPEYEHQFYTWAEVNFITKNKWSGPDFSLLGGRWLSTEKACEWIRAMKTFLCSTQDEQFHEDLFELKLRMIQIIEWDNMCKEYANL